jgi:hypothetical protein
MNGNIGKLEPAEYKDLTLRQLYADFDGQVPLEQCMQLLGQMKAEQLWLCHPQ